MIMQTKQPKLIVPVGARKPIKTYTPRERQVLRGLMHNVKVQRDYITLDDIIEVKKQRNKLQQKKLELIAKIARIESLNLHPANDNINHMVADSVESQIEAAAKVLADRKAEVNKILNSDLTASIIEEQEFTKIMHLEIARLQESKHMLEAECCEAEGKLVELLREYSPERLEEEYKINRDLKKKIECKETSIDSLMNPEKYFESMKDKKIREEENARLIEKLKENISTSKKNIKTYQNEVKELQEELERLRASGYY